MQSRRRLRQYLVYNDLTDATVPVPTIQVREAKVYNANGAGGTPKGFLFCPMDWYPLISINQVVFRWYLKTMPTAATYVTLTPVSFESLRDLNDASTSNDTILSGYGLVSGSRPAFARLAFDQFTTTGSGFVSSLYFAFKKTAADTDYTMGSGNTLRVGTRDAFPIAENYLGFIVEHDGTDGTGEHTIAVDLGWA